MIRLPPSSPRTATLFPDTTLFRSLVQAEERATDGEGVPRQLRDGRRDLPHLAKLGKRGAGQLLGNGLGVRWHDVATNIRDALPLRIYHRLGDLAVSTERKEGGGSLCHTIGRA